MALEKLQNIRAKFLPPDVVLKNPCPKCGHELTIEKTEFFESQLCENCFDHAKIVTFDPCCKTPAYSPVKLITSANTIQVREQCSNCGNMKGNSIGGYTKEQKDKLPLADLSKRDHLQSEINKAWNASFERKNKGRHELFNKKNDRWFSDYNKYLETPYWKNIRQLVLKRDNYLCQCCLSGYATQVHHKSYEFVDFNGNEPCFDLVAICTPCHERLHKIRNSKKQAQ